MECSLKAVEQSTRPGHSENKCLRRGLCSLKPKINALEMEKRELVDRDSSRDGCDQMSGPLQNQLFGAGCRPFLGLNQ